MTQAAGEQLEKLLEFALEHSEHYRQLGIQRPAGSTPVEFLGQFPILSRDQVRDRFAEIVADSLRDEITSPASTSRKRYDWLVVKTGGTTGVPTAVVHDAVFRDWGRATRLYSQQLCGFPLGTPYFRLWGSEQDLLQQQEKFDRRVLRNLLGEIPMNAFRSRESELRQHLQTMKENPGVVNMMAYVDAAVSLARFIEDQKLEVRKLETIMACAGTVTLEWRTVLRKVFQADVFDKYGSRECADIACECSSHSGLHVYSPNVYVEIVDAAGRACPPGQPGRILVTLLRNLSFPMIRYEIGDMGTWARPGRCMCGRAFPRLESLEGRQDEMLTTEDGTLLSSVFIRHFVGVSLNRELIREWQFEQTGPITFVFRYRPLREEGLRENLWQLEQSFKKALGSSARIDLQRVTEIKPSATGKIRWVVNSYSSGSKAFPER